MKKILLRLVIVSLAVGLSAVLSSIPTVSTGADTVPPEVAAAEAKRVETVKKVQPAVVAVFAPGGQGGGSGVLIDEEGYALTNFHVVEGPGPVMQCGLADGVLYDAVLVGLDKVGDVALIKLLPKKEGQKFPFAKMGDSDKLRAGDWSMAMGNPFLLATDFTPTVTFGLISGVQRYQYPAGTLLEYTSCIQIDTSINPGNSGGPLFNLDGELVGINGRGSFEKRGRVNSGVGYAISINQIKNFEWHLRAGLDSDHASLGALVTSDEEEGSLGKLLVTSIITDSDVARRGLDIDDELVRFAGKPLSSVNDYKNVLGLFPRGWRVPVKFRHVNEQKKTEEKEVLVRLMGVQKREIKDPKDKDEGSGQPKPGPKPKINSPATKLYEARPGYANFYFNRQLREQQLKDFAAHGDFKKHNGTWVLEGDANIEGGRPQKFAMSLESDKKEKQKLEIVLEGINLTLDPTSAPDPKKIIDTPPASGGFLMAMHHYRDLLTMPGGEKTFEGDFSHGGREPYYLPTKGSGKPNFAEQRIDCNVLRTKHAAITAKWYFAAKDNPKAALKAGALVGMELVVDDEHDPCEVYFSDYKDVGGKMFPHKIDVRYGNTQYGTFSVSKVVLGEAK